MPARRTVKRFVGALSLAALLGCSGDEGSGERQPDAGREAQRQPQDAGGSKGSAAGERADDFDNAAPDSSRPVVEATGSDDDVCAGEIVSGQPVPVDLYVMLDSSQSMRREAGDGSQSKWEAIRSALGDFVEDDASRGLGVGLQYFPLATPGVPDQCMTDEDCGQAGGPCMNRACTLAEELTPCLTNQHCPAAGSLCVPFGECAADGGFACTGIGAQCVDETGEDFGLCQRTTYECLAWASCDVAQYATPAVSVGTLPANGAAIVDSLAAHQPKGNTPTAPALRGAIEHIWDHGVRNPDHRVFAVLATDGLPTDCAPPDIDLMADIPQQLVVEATEVAQSGVDSVPEVRTFVIGVFSPDDEGALQNLDAIADAGGTDSAFIVDPGHNVAQQFLEALDAIRGEALACEFQIPEPDDTSADLDFGEVNLLFTNRTGETTELVYVGSSDNCDRADSGWFYDVDPEQETPTKIQVCENVCEHFQQGGDVDVRIGCDTVTVF